MKKKTLTIFILTLLFSAFFSTSVFAGEKQSFEVSPGKDSINLDPGTTYENTIQVHNNGNIPIHVDAGILPYHVNNHTYEPIYEQTKYTEITKWITLSTESFDLNPDETIFVGYSVTVPEDVPAGGQYAIIAFDSVSVATENSTVEAIQRIGVIVNAEISGDTRMSGEIVEQKIEAFKFQPPITASVSVSNNGNVNSTVSSVMKIFNYFDGSEVYTNASNPTVNDVYPDTIRDITMAWDSSPKLGIFNVVLTTSYLNDISTITKTVFICPLWLIIVVLIIIFAFIIIIIAKIRKRQKIHHRSSRFNV